MHELLTQPKTPEIPRQVAGIKSEWWPASNRNGGRHQIGIPGRLPSESPLAQKGQPAVAAEEFQLWKLAVNADTTGTLTCEDGNGSAVFIKRLDYTDFPAEGVELYYVNNTILLPSEY